MLVTLSNFNTFTNDYETSDTIDALKSSCIESAEGIISNYLGYSLLKTEYKYKFKNIYAEFILLPAYITSIKTLIINNQEINSADIIINKIYVTIKNYYNYKNIEIDIDFFGGWEITTLPSIIKITICEIATLLYLQTNKNIGITGLIGTDGLSRTFINYTNFDKYVKKLEGYKR